MPLEILNLTLTTKRDVFCFIQLQNQTPVVHMSSLAQNGIGLGTCRLSRTLAEWAQWAT